MNKKEYADQHFSGNNNMDRRSAIASFGIAGLTLAGIPVHSLKEREGKKDNEVRLYENVSAMKADRKLESGMIAATMGYFRAGDGGGTMYAVKGESPKGEPDDGGIIGLANQNSACLVNTTFVNYKMFGARSDGEYDDGIAIRKTHDFANANKIPVVNLSGAFWIKNTYNIDICTNVDWGHSIFHIDEQFNSQKAYHFRVRSQLTPYPIELEPNQKAQLLQKVKPGVEVLAELAPYSGMLVFISDKNDKIGYRAGARFTGQEHTKEDFFYVEEDGRIIGEVAWTFSDYTTLTAYPCDNNYLIIDGGTFYLSGDNPGKTYNGYWKNGFSVSRSRTVIRNQWVGLEPNHSDIALTPRSGFYTFSRVFDVALENVRLIPWIQDRDGEEKDVKAGTYGISCGRTLQTRFFNVTAEGGRGYWGVFGTNLNKRFFIDHCNLNRVDVHFHCWNLHILNSNIGFKGITVTGGGNLIIENTKVWSRRYFVSFRRDFGSRWDGDIYIRNCRFIPGVKGETSVLNFAPANFDYHYSIGFGHKVVVKDLVIDYHSCPDNADRCWLMRVPSFSEVKGGRRLFFPTAVLFENITIAGRKKGIRLIEIAAPQHYNQPKVGKYDESGLQTNSTMVFDRIELEQLADALSSSDPEVHLLINHDTTQAYKDDHALYPEIYVKDCKAFSAIVNGSANLYLERTTVNRLVAGASLPIKGRLEIQNCLLQAMNPEQGKPPFILAAESGVSFLNCTFLAPREKGVLKPSLFDFGGILSINEYVKHNHVNSRLGGAIRTYCKNRHILLKPGFINKLKLHNDLEMDN